MRTVEKKEISQNKEPKNRKMERQNISSDKRRGKSFPKSAVRKDWWNTVSTLISQKLARAETVLWSIFRKQRGMLRKQCDFCENSLFWASEWEGAEGAVRERRKSNFSPRYIKVQKNPFLFF